MKKRIAMIQGFVYNNEKGIELNEKIVFNVSAENDKKIVIENDMFTVLEKEVMEGSSYGYVLGVTKFTPTVRKDARFGILLYVEETDDIDPYQAVKNDILNRLEQEISENRELITKVSNYKK